MDRTSAAIARRTIEHARTGMIDTDRQWEKWGREDPYFAVLSEPRFRAGCIDRHREDFFLSGQAFIDDVLRRYQEAFGELPRDRVLDHGCGVGRLTLPLAERFSSVVALDVSPAMLAEARANADVRQITNVRFHLADDALSGADGAFDFVVSHLVLQHVPVRRGMRIFSNLLDKVRRGGGFHITLSYRTERPAHRLLYWASANIPGVKGWQNLCAGRRWNAPAMQMNNYPVETVGQQLCRRKIANVMTSAVEHERFRTVTFIGRLPADA